MEQLQGLSEIKLEVSLLFTIMAYGQGYNEKAKAENEAVHC